jgi:hypothetical protein
MIELPYGRVPYPRDLGRTATVLAPPPRPAPRERTRHLLLEALDHCALDGDSRSEPDSDSDPGPSA